MPKKLREYEHISYSQGNEAAKTKIDPSHSIHSGVCFSLCCQWIQLHKQNRSEGSLKRRDAMTQRIKELGSDNIMFYRAVNSQMNTYGISNSKTKLGQKNETGNKYGIKFVDSLGTTLCSSKSYKTDVLLNEVNHPHRYTQTSFQLKNGRHAICAYRSNGKIFGLGAHLYVFDPNFGEFRISPSEIEDFYTALFDKYKPVHSHITFRVDDC